MRILKLTKDSKKNLLEELLKRSPNQYKEYEARVYGIIEEVRSKGDAALFSYTEQFDGAVLDRGTIQVTKEEIETAYQQLDPKLVDVMGKSMENIKSYHEKQRQYSWFDSKPNGVMLGQKVSALARVGVYVPGGKAAYPSSVLMNVLPAKVAGVEEIIMTTPCGRDGMVNPGTDRKSVV